MRRQALVAVIVDGDNLRVRLRSHLGRTPLPDDFLQYAASTLRQEEELFRVYFYDCPPATGAASNPISGQKTVFDRTVVYEERDRALKVLARSDHVALRRGVLQFNGWKIGKRSFQEITETRRAVRAEDLEPDFKQKRVDIMIGLDVAWLSSKRLVDRLVLISGDSDFVPAMKFARREGVQIVLALPDRRLLNEALYEHADEFRLVPCPLAAPASGSATAGPDQDSVRR